MNRPGLRVGHLGGLAGAALVLLSLWQPWYGIDIGASLRSELDARAGALPGTWAQAVHGVIAALPSTIALDGWTSLKAADVVLCVLALVAVLLVVAATGALGPGIAVERSAAARMISGLGAVALLIAIEHLLVRPSLPLASVELRHGVWIAVLGSLLMLAGGASASAPERRPDRPHFAPPEPAAPASSSGGTSVAPPGA